MCCGSAGGQGHRRGTTQCPPRPEQKGAGQASKTTQGRAGGTLPGRTWRNKLGPSPCLPVAPLRAAPAQPACPRSSLTAWAETSACSTACPAPREKPLLPCPGTCQGRAVGSTSGEGNWKRLSAKASDYVLLTRALRAVGTETPPPPYGKQPQLRVPLTRCGNTATKQAQRPAGRRRSSGC